MSYMLVHHPARAVRLCMSASARAMRRELGQAAALLLAGQGRVRRSRSRLSAAGSALGPVYSAGSLPSHRVEHTARASYGPIRPQVHVDYFVESKEVNLPDVTGAVLCMPRTHGQLGHATPGQSPPPSLGTGKPAPFLGRLLAAHPRSLGSNPGTALHRPPLPRTRQSCSRHLAP